MQCGHDYVGVRILGGRWARSEGSKGGGVKRHSSLETRCRRWHWYSLILLRTHADEGDRTVRESEGRREGELRYHITLEVKSTRKQEHSRCRKEWKEKYVQQQSGWTKHRGKAQKMVTNIHHMWSGLSPVTLSNISFKIDSWHRKCGGWTVLKGSRWTTGPVSKRNIPKMCVYAQKRVDYVSSLHRWHTYFVQFI